MKHQLRLLTLFGVVAAATGCGMPHAGQCIKPHHPLISPRTNVLPPAQMLMHPGPGVDGPGPGVFMTGTAAMAPSPAPVTQIGFIGPEGMMVNWDVGGPGLFDSEGLVVPGRFNFPQGAIYRLKLTNIPGRPGVELYPTLEIGPTTPRTGAYLAHNHVPFQLTEEDFDQVLTGNFVTKVIYLPDPLFQELAIAGVAELVSTRLDPGVDPIIEADRRGSILGIVRIGNKDLEVPGSLGVENGGPMPAGYAGPGAGMPPAFVAGLTAPQYGMPMSGTPIGLPGPPHIPLGVPAGLQQHVVKNHTHMHIPAPTERVGIHVQQKPGLSYPKPVNSVHIVEESYPAPVHYRQPPEYRNQTVPGAGTDGNCAPGGESYDYNAQ